MGTGCELFECTACLLARKIVGETEMGKFWMYWKNMIAVF